MTPFIFWLVAILAGFVTGLLLQHFTPDAGASLFPLAEDPDTYSLPFNVTEIER